MTENRNNLLLQKSGQGPLVTMLISTHNRPAYLAEALESIFRQTYPNFEIILVRDGGLPVRDVVGRFNDARLHFIDRDENKGLPYSFNEALATAKGEYVCYLGDDDRFYPHHIATLMQAALQNPEYGVVYSDLYKAHCRVLPDGLRRVLSKNVEISRDFDRMLMMQFNHALHVSLMHRRDLLEHAGRYNEKLNVLIDWDLTHRLCFYTDFLHIPVITGEYYAPVGNCDRISVQRRKDVGDYLRNLITIRTTRPQKPWPKVDDLSVLIVGSRLDEPLLTTAREIWSRTYYPNRIFIPMTQQEYNRFRCGITNLVPIIVSDLDTPEQRLARMMEMNDAPLTAILTSGISIPPHETIYLERSINPLISSKNNQAIYQIKESDEAHFGAVGRTELLRNAQRRGYSLLSAQALRSAGLDVRISQYGDYPFKFDNVLCSTELMQIEGHWDQAAKIYDFLASEYGNEIWMRTRQANALYHAGKYAESAGVAGRLNQKRPSVATYLIEARARKKMEDYTTAIELYRNAQAILDGRTTGRMEQKCDVKLSKPVTQPICRQLEETLVWT